MGKTQIFLFGTLLVVLLWDIYVVFSGGGTDESISQVLTDASYNSHLICFGAGLLTAHFFGWMMFPKVQKRTTVCETGDRSNE